MGPASGLGIPSPILVVVEATLALVVDESTAGLAVMDRGGDTELPFRFENAVAAVPPFSDGTVGGAPVEG